MSLPLLDQWAEEDPSSQKELCPGPSKPQKLAFEPFPLECFPDAVRAFVENTTDALGCDHSMVAVPALACLAGAIGGSRALELKSGWTEPSALWVGVVADSGSLKTPALKACLEPFWDIQNEHNQEYQKKYEEFEKAQGLAKRTQKKGVPIPPSEPADPPVLKRAIVGDITIQKMAEVQSETQRGTFCSVDELSGWFGGLSRYANGGSDLSQWLSLHSASALQVDRKTGKPIFVRRALASIAGGIQPGILKRHLSPDFTESGAAARFLFAMPPKRTKQWRECGVSPTVRASWNKLIRDLLALEMVGGAEPGLIPLDPKAKTLWVGFYQDHAKAQQEASGPWAAILAKLEGMAGRLSMVLGMADRAARNREDLSPLEPIWVEAGTTLARWFQRERSRIETALTEPEPGLVTLVDRLQTMLREAGSDGITKTSIHEKLNRNFSALDIKKALDSLSLQGLAKGESEPTKGRPTETWRATSGFLRTN